MSYKKFTLDTFKEKLKNGDYEASVGAMRAIGKTQELSEAEKEKARALVRKHFGIEETAGAKPARAKKAAKKTSKKAAKKAEAKAAVVRKKRGSKKAAAAPAVKPVSNKVGRRGPRRAKAATSTTEVDTSGDNAAGKEPTVSARDQRSSSSKEPVLMQMTQVISTVSDSLKAMEAAKRIFPKGHFDSAADVAGSTLARAVKVLDEKIVAPHHPQTAAASRSPASSTGARKKGAKQGTRTKVESDPPPISEDEEVEETEDSPESAPQVHGEENLSEDELEQLRIAREVQAQSG